MEEQIEESDEIWTCWGLSTSMDGVGCMRETYILLLEGVGNEIWDQ